MLLATTAPLHSLAVPPLANASSVAAPPHKWKGGEGGGVGAAGGGVTDLNWTMVAAVCKAAPCEAPNLAASSEKGGLQTPCTVTMAGVVRGAEGVYLR